MCDEKDASADPNVTYRVHLHPSKSIHSTCQVCGLRVGGEHETVSVLTAVGEASPSKLETYCFPCYVLIHIRADYSWKVKLPMILNKFPVIKLPAYLIKDGEGLKLFRPTDPAYVALIRGRNLKRREECHHEDEPS